MLQEESSSWTPAPLPSLNGGSKEQRVNPSDYYTSACGVTTAVMADPFISGAKSSSASRGVLHD